VLPTKPPLTTPTNPEANANAAYAKVVEFYHANKAGSLSPEKRDTRFTTPEAAKLVNLLVTAGNAGRFKFGSWDEHIPPFPRARYETVEILQDVAEIIGPHAINLYQKDKKAQTTVATKALARLR
jgi:hypothetical protein